MAKKKAPARKIRVARTRDLKAGTMKAVAVEGDHRVLLCNVGGTITALGASCTHYGAPLADGVLSGDRIVCPWHHACFHAGTGDLLEPPAFDALPSYKVTVEKGEIFVTPPARWENSRSPSMTGRTRSGAQETYVIIGGGAAGMAAAQALREEGFSGGLVMLTREDRAPYDRPNLSKDYLSGEADPAWMPLRSDDFFASHDIDLRRNQRVRSVDIALRSIVLETGKSLSYDRLLLATGGVPRVPAFAGNGRWDNVFTLRSFDDADAIIHAADRSQHIVIIGSSFIGMEVAASLTERKRHVTVVGAGNEPFEKVLGRDIGRLLRSLHEKHGVTFRMNVEVTGFSGTTVVQSVSLNDGTTLNADMVVFGVGVSPATEYLDGLPRGSDGSITVDSNLRAAPDVFVAGDIARFPNRNSYVRVEHWRVALQLGRIAGQNMAGRKVECNLVPFFWTQQAGLSLRYVGYADRWDDIVTTGSVDTQDFISFFIRENTVLAAAGCNRDTEMAAIEELMRRDNMPAADVIRKGGTDFRALVMD
jgi:NADPH-dependent 2,4-dienoyl-CoA reductase/sulfur reductase-like enzyme/nitrite reductase/ring-hydroxylating ferredoxin subunit